jgi:hypothetical protein
MQDDPSQNLFWKDDTTLLITCDNLVTIEIENTLKGRAIVYFRRDGDRWLMVGASDKDNSKHICINTATGEMYKIPYILGFRSTITFSPDKRLALVISRICASNADKVWIVDMTDWNNVTIIHNEEMWDHYDWDVKFDEDGNVVFTYNFTFWSLDDIVICLDGNLSSPHGEEDGYSKMREKIWGLMERKSPVDENYSISLEDLISVGGEVFFLTSSVTRRRDPTKITPDDPKKWKEIEISNESSYKKFWKSYIKVDEMEIVANSSNNKYKRKNIVVDSSNFEKYL